MSKEITTTKAKSLNSFKRKGELRGVMRLKNAKLLRSRKFREIGFGDDGSARWMKMPAIKACVLSLISRAHVEVGEKQVVL